MSIKVLNTPVRPEDITEIHVGDIIYLSGNIVTCRDVAHRRVVNEHMQLPVDIDGGAIIHAGPIVKPVGNDKFEMISIGPTTSMRMEKFEYEFIKKTGVRIIIGKGGMGEGTQEGCRIFKALHCVFPAGCAVVAATKIEKIEEVDKIDLNKDVRLYSQTTKSLDEFRSIVSYIEQNISKSATFQYFDTICRQVANRMPNIRKFAASHDVILFVCGQKSSNGKILFHECKEINPKTYQVDKPEDINMEWFGDAKSIGICGATSTPKWLMDKCKNLISEVC